MRKFLAAIFLSLALVLGGCASGPSEDDVQTACIEFVDLGMEAVDREIPDAERVERTRAIAQSIDGHPVADDMRAFADAVESDVDGFATFSTVMDNCNTTL